MNAEQEQHRPFRPRPIGPGGFADDRSDSEDPYLRFSSGMNSRCFGPT